MSGARRGSRVGRDSAVARPRRGSRLLGGGGTTEVLLEEAAALAQALVGEDHRLGLADRIEDQPLAVQPGEHVPVMPLPGAIPVVQREVEQGEHGLVDLLRIGFQGGTVPRAKAERKVWPCLSQGTEQSRRSTSDGHRTSFARAGVVGNWWSQPGSNWRPPACKAGALPTEL